MPLEPINDREYVNEVLTVVESGYTPIPAGMYKTKFDGLEKTTTSNGPAYRWWFTVEDGEYAGRSVNEYSDRIPSTLNKCGRFFVALAKKPLEKDVQHNPNDYIGKRYMIIVEPRPKNPKDTMIASFTMLDN
ncbi:hypothetical protein Pan153_41540 [Gimesia panareensis]|uniref:Uncharacterized protein n=1 Tax=Gimesia panareensis TaxID=2527978 RepID=A0A518FT16_9PLAN|nr:hypothetical protein [Gimesia panareensis]QDV19488.1 hypothetical protein Pan153_41540 [Gimesia panareensis]